MNDQTTRSELPEDTVACECSPTTNPGCDLGTHAEAEKEAEAVS